MPTHPGSGISMNLEETMSHGISKGDLVMIVKPSHCCSNGKALGRVFTVTAIDHRGARCRHCGQTFPGPTVMCSDRLGYLPARVKRIPPIDASESSASEIELHAA